MQTWARRGACHRAGHFGPDSVARVAGIALIALGIACWRGPPLVGMLIYSALVTMYLVYLGLVSGLTGVFLWPAVALHAILTALLSYDTARMRCKRLPTK
jgi:hypothetical protein